jgi:hypothetical protein
MRTIRSVTRFLAPVAALAVAAGCGASGSTSTHAATTHAATTTKQASGGSSVAMVQKCSTSDLEIWLGLGGGGAAAGSTYYPLEITNVSNHRCRLFGFPGVSAISVSGRQPGSPAQRDRSHPTYHVSLLPGSTVHTVVRIADVLNFPASRCKPVAASGLRVYPPDQTEAAEIPFGFRACSVKGPIFLSVQAVQPGVGIPGR